MISDKLKSGIQHLYIVQVQKQRILKLVRHSLKQMVELNIAQIKKYLDLKNLNSKVKVQDEITNNEVGTNQDVLSKMKQTFS